MFGIMNHPQLYNVSIAFGILFALTLRGENSFNLYRTYAKPENSVYHGTIGAVRKPHLPGKCVSSIFSFNLLWRIYNDEYNL